jgi:hypothetical protein
MCLRILPGQRRNAGGEGRRRSMAIKREYFGAIFQAEGTMPIWDWSGEAT